jgi:uncharacterized protein (TIGR03085 family)
MTMEGGVHDMGLTELRSRERVELCATLREVGPDAPTLCDRWTATDIAAHMVVSERASGLPMVFAYGLRRVLPARVTLRAMRSLSAVGERQTTKTRRHGWTVLLDRLAAGPPSPYRLASVAPIRLIEEWIHHEDIRRANELPSRPARAEVDEALWKAALRLTAFPEFLPGRDGIEVVLPDGRSRRLGAVTRVRVEGPPGEALLYLSGRTTAAQVAVSGDDDAIRALDGNLVV